MFIMTSKGNDKYVILSGHHTKHFVENKQPRYFVLFSTLNILLTETCLHRFGHTDVNQFVIDFDQQMKNQ